MPMYISCVIHGVMQEMGYSEDQIGQYFIMSGDATVTKIMVGNWLVALTEW